MEDTTTASRIVETDPDDKPEDKGMPNSKFSAKKRGAALTGDVASGERPEDNNVSSVKVPDAGQGMNDSAEKALGTQSASNNSVAAKPTETGVGDRNAETAAAPIVGPEVKPANNKPVSTSPALTLTESKPAPNEPASAKPEKARRVPWRAVLVGVAATIAVIFIAERLGLISFGRPGDPPAVATAAVPAAMVDESALRISSDRANAASALAAETQAETRQLAASLGTIGDRVEGVRLVTAALLLDSAIRGSGPFIGELAVAMQAADGQPELLAILDRLMPWAENGMATRGELERRFSQVASQARLVAYQDTPTLQSATHVMRDIALWVGIGEAPEADSQRVLIRAADLVEQGSLPGAVETLSRLDGLALTVVAPWVANVNARLSIENDVANFRREALRHALEPAK